MAVQLPVPLVSYSEIEVSLSGITYILNYRFNTTFKKDENDEGTWMLDIMDSNRNFIIKGLGVVGQGFLMDNLIVEGFDHGDILCSKNQQTTKRPTRNNVGIDNEYILVYLTNEEIADVFS
jgi:hypothetical protein